MKKMENRRGPPTPAGQGRMSEERCVLGIAAHNYKRQKPSLAKIVQPISNHQAGLTKTCKTAKSNHA